MSELEEKLQGSVERANGLPLAARKRLCEQVFAIPEEELEDVQFRFEPPLTIVAEMRMYRSVETIHTTITIGENGNG